LIRYASFQPLSPTRACVVAPPTPVSMSGRQPEVSRAGAQAGVARLYHADVSLFI